jgi:hypothetical protein
MRQQFHIAMALANMATHTGLFAVVRARLLLVACFFAALRSLHS